MSLEKLPPKHVIAILRDKGYMRFDPDKQWDKECLEVDDTLRMAFKQGWLKAQTEYEEQMRIEKCPYCNSNMEERGNINWCTNTVHCGHHIHLDD